MSVRTVVASFPGHAVGLFGGGGGGGGGGGSGLGMRLGQLQL